MKYNIVLNDEDYLRFNIFHTTHSKAGKRSINTFRALVPICFAVILLVLWVYYTKPSLLICDAIISVILSVVWYFWVPKLMERSAKSMIRNLKADGKLPYSPNSEIEFQDMKIVEKSEQSEIRVNYSDIQNIYFEKDSIYIFYSAMQAFIIPYRCLGEDKEQVIEYIMQKKG